MGTISILTGTLPRRLSLWGAGHQSGTSKEPFWTQLILVWNTHGPWSPTAPELNQSLLFTEQLCDLQQIVSLSETSPHAQGELRIQGLKVQGWVEYVQKAPVAEPVCGGQCVDLFPQLPPPQLFKVQGRPAPTVQSPALSLDGSMPRERGHLAWRGPEDPVSLRRAGRGQWAGSWRQMWMGHIWGSGPAWRTTEPTHPLSGGAGPSLSPVLRVKRGTHLSWPVFTQ